MEKEELIDARVSLNQCKKAVEALHSHETKKQQKLDENELLPGKEQNIWLNVTVKRIPAGHRFKPCKIPIVHPLVDPRTTPVCLLTKDPQREYKDLLEAHSIKFISRVVGVEKLKGKFKPYEARRMLLKENGLFLADERIIPILPKLLGSKWFETKKQPIPVCLTRKDLKGELERAISSTYMNQNQGTYTSIKVANLSHKPAQILANIKTALPVIAKTIHGGWDNIQSFNIKTSSSMSLPIWSCNLDDEEGGRWDGFAPKSDAEDSADGIDEDMEVDEEPKKATQGKGKKRTSTDDEGEAEAEKPRKKAKGILPPTVASSISKALPEAPVSIPAPPTSSVMAGKANADASSKSKKRKAKHTSSTPSQLFPTAAATPTTEPIPTAATSATSASLPEAEPAQTTAAAAVDAAKPKKRKNKKDAVPATATLLEAEPAPTTAAPAVDVAKPKKRKNKKDAVPATATLLETEPAPTTAAPAVDAAKPKKRKDKKDAVPATATLLEAEPAPTTAAPAVDAAKPKKRRDRKSAVPAAATLLEAQPAPSTATPAVDAAKPKKRKDREGAVPAAATLLETQSAPSTATPSTAAPAVDATQPKKRKNKKDAVPTVAALPDTQPAPTTVSQTDLKQKRSAASGEKKKDKVVKKKGGKSAKDGVLGKKAAQV